MSDPSDRRIALEHAARFTHLPPEQVPKAAHSFLSFLENWAYRRVPPSAPSGQPQRLIQPPADLPAGFACYRSHKTVWADKIEKSRNAHGTGTRGLQCQRRCSAGRARHVRTLHPVPGDYLVIYEDGHQPISPKAAFEGGYTKG